MLVKTLSYDANETIWILYVDAYIGFIGLLFNARNVILLIKKPSFEDTRLIY